MNMLERLFGYFDRGVNDVEGTAKYGASVFNKWGGTILLIVLLFVLKGVFQIKIKA